MSVLYKKYIPMGITAITGLIVILDYYIKVPVINNASKAVTSWGSHLAYFATLLALLTILRQSQRKIARQEKDWYFYVYLLVILASMVGLGLVFTTSDSRYTWMYDNFYRPVGSTMMALMGFYFMSATYRAFRVRSVPVLFAMIACIVILISVAPAGPVWFPGIRNVSIWIEDYFSQAGIRAFTMAGAIGSLGVGIRVLTGRETGYFGKEEEEE